MIDEVLQRLEANREAGIERIKELLSIPSVSTDPAYAEHCRTAADWVADQLREAGFAVEVKPTAGHPVVLGRAGAEQPGPRLLFYGHYDVQPPDPLDRWETGPFEPTIREQRIYARGASDDKGQVCCFLEALRAWREAAGGPPLPVTVMIEGEEECGSENLESFMASQRESLAADIALVSDTAMWSASTPAITYALRGLLYFDVKLHGPSHDLHSGVYGGAVPNPATELAGVLGQLFDDRHRVTLDGFYDDVVALDDAERQRWSQLGFNERDFAESVGLNPDGLHGEADFATLERRWARPSCDVNGLYGGYMGEGAKTVIPSFAGAKVSFRLAAQQDPQRIAEAFEKWLDARTPPGCRWETREFGRAHPVIVPTDSPFIRAARESLKQGSGREPVLIREGATIPVVSSFKRLLELDTLLLGYGLHDDRIHSPNEKFELAGYDIGRRTDAVLLSRLADV